MILKLSRRRRAVARKCIRDVSVYLRHLLRHPFDRFGPQIDLVRAIDLDSRVIDQIAVRSHPSDVPEVSGGTRGETQHQLAWNPATIGQHERNVVLLE